MLDSKDGALNASGIMLSLSSCNAGSHLNLRAWLSAEGPVTSLSLGVLAGLSLSLCACGALLQETGTLSELVLYSSIVKKGVFLLTKTF